MAFIPDQRVPLAAGLASLAIAVGLFWLRRRLGAAPVLSNVTTQP